MTKTTNKAAPDQEFTPSIGRDKQMIEELRADPAYAEIYLQTALEEIYEPAGIPAFLTALRRIIEARGGVGEIVKNPASVASISTVRCLRTATRHYPR